MGKFLGIFLAIALHVGVILFGGIFFLNGKKAHANVQDVELLSEVDAEKPPEEQPPEEPEELETEPEEVPNVADILRDLAPSPIADAPELDAASLSAIEAALDGSGAGGGGDFASGFDFASGGRIGGTGKAGALDAQVESAFSMAEIDQKPTPLFQGAPQYPSEMRGKKVDGKVTLIFVVDAGGKVADPRIEKSSHAAFEKPALDAVRHWKFEPGVKSGRRVACKMRETIRFQPS